MKLVPDRKKFMVVISGTGDLDSDIEKFCTGFSSVLAENHKFLVSFFTILYIYMQHDPYHVSVEVYHRKLLSTNNSKIIECGFEKI